MGKFAEFLKEQDNEKPYKLLIVSHDDPLDPNETAPLVRKKASELGLQVYLAEFMGAYMEDDGDDKLFYSYPVSDKGTPQLPSMKDDSEYDKPFRINSKNTLIMMRGLNARDGSASWFTMARNLENDGYTVINSVLCNEICNDKWYNQMIFQKNNINTPKTVLVRHAEGSAFAAEKLKNKYPMILKTSVGSRGVGVMWVESDKALQGIVQLLYREDPYVDILLQEYIKTEYDVRVIIVANKILGAMKRPLISGDFRSNVSQGSEPEIHELTELEASESLRAAKSVDGSIVGVDFIPAKNREKETPYFIEVNSTPGLVGIESTLSKAVSKPLVKQKGISITSEILKRYMNRDLWKKTPQPCGIYETFKHKVFGEMVGTMDTGNSAPNSVIHADEYKIKGKQITITIKGDTITTNLVGTTKVGTGAGDEERPIVKLDIEFNKQIHKSLTFTVDDRTGKSTLLMNRNFLNDLNLYVNPSREYMLSTKTEIKEGVNNE